MLKKVLIVVVLVVVLGVGGLLTYLNVAFPKVGPARDHKVNATPELVERGRYLANLANHVNVCIDCHSTRDWTRFAVPITPRTDGKGEDLGALHEYLRSVPPAKATHAKWTPT